MCSILGGTSFDDVSVTIFNKAKDRGRDFSGMVQRGSNWIANHRATPTNELEDPIENQPLGQGIKLVHNGTIANDEELGYKEGEIDSSVLVGALDWTDLESWAKSFQRIKGSFAIAALVRGEIWLACNYKPIFYTLHEGEFYFSSLENHLPGRWVQRMRPYSVMNLVTGEWYDIIREQSKKALVVCSGGLDSTAVAGFVRNRHFTTTLLHFDYGCKATDREIESIKQIAKFLECDYKILPIEYKHFHGQSTLFKEDNIETGKAGVEYALDWVPARNTLMLASAAAYAEAHNYGHIYLGTNLEESGAYPDNEEQYIRDFNKMMYGVVNEGKKIEIKAPLGGLMKREIVSFGVEHNSPLHLSYSCYNGRDKHCGACGPCYMRQKAFLRAGQPDPTEYEQKIK